MAYHTRLTFQSRPRKGAHQNECGSSAWGTSIAETDGDIVAGVAGSWTATATPVFGKNAIANGTVGLANGNSGGATYTLENVTGTSPIVENQPPLAASGVKGCTNATGTETCSFSGDSNHSYFSGTQTSAVTTQTLCSTTYCTAGTYQVLVYVNETGTGCTTVGTGTVKTELNYTNNQSNPVSGQPNENGIVRAKWQKSSATLPLSCSSNSR